jgi:hypothetical protein
MKQLEVTDQEWLESIQETRQITADSLNAVGVPIRYQKVKGRNQYHNAFISRVLTSQRDSEEQAKSVLTSYVVSCLDRATPGVSIQAITFADLIATLINTKAIDIRQSIYCADMIFIYDLGLFGLRDWEQAALVKFIMNRYNNEQHIATATENIPHATIAKNIGKTAWDILTNYCECNEVD